MTQRGRNTTVSLRIREDVLEHLREVARKAAVERQQDISYADLIREAVDRMYPREEWKP